jgi:hypothetical protein
MFCTGAGTRRAENRLLDTHMLHRALYRFLERNVEFKFQILACEPLCLLGSSAAPSTEETLEDFGNISKFSALESREIEPRESPAVESGTWATGCPELVEHLPFLGIAEDLIGLVNSLELRFRIFFSFVFVRVPFLAQLPVRAFDVLIRGIPRKPKDVIGVLHMGIVAGKCRRRRVPSGLKPNMLYLHDGPKATPKAPRSMQAWYRLVSSYSYARSGIF